jgi:hypothetical protein
MRVVLHASLQASGKADTDRHEEKDCTTMSNTQVPFDRPGARQPIGRTITASTGDRPANVGLAIANR